MLAVSNMSAIEIGPTGSGVELSGFIDWYYQVQDAPDGTDADTWTDKVELILIMRHGPISASD